MQLSVVGLSTAGRSIRSFRLIPFFALLISSVACSSETDTPSTPAGADAGTPASGHDAGHTDAGRTDAAAQVPAEGTCVIAANAAPAYVQKLGCTADFQALASEPLDDSIPGARSAKVVLDQDDGQLYFQNTNLYKIHYDFVSKHLSGNGRPTVTSLSEFNETQYLSPTRRFLLGAVTYYSGPKLWALEIAPYDTAGAAQVQALFNAVQAAAFFGAQLVFHPTSEAVAAEAKSLPGAISVKSTDDVYQGIDYQPLNLGEAVGKLRFLKSSELESNYLGYRDMVVLDNVPNDISVVAGLITQEFQTPLAHVNVLAQNRKTPNMGLRNATTNPQLKALDGKWVKLKVSAFEWNVTEVSQAEADAFWEAHKPVKVSLPQLDLAVTDLRNLEDVTEQAAGKKVTRDAIAKAVKAFGAKATNYSVLTHTTGIPIKKAFAIPAYFYVQFMQENGFTERLQTLLADAQFRGEATVRDAQLKQLRTDIKAAPINSELQTKLKAKLESDYPGQTIRFRSSTNAEDLDGFPCAGCYDSHTGDPANWEGDLLLAIKQTWATVWSFRTFEEREYHSIDHFSVGMALLVHHNFPEEEANGVAVTANPYDPTGNSPGFYVNVQQGGDAEVVAPPEGVTSDSFIYQFSFTGSPIIYLTHSNLVDAGKTVLSTRQVHDLGVALDAIHNAFTDAYGAGAGNTGWYAMDVEFKFDDEANPGTPSLYIKQARPYPGRGN